MIFFVTETYIKERTVIAENVDVKRIVPHTEVMSDMHIQETLGRYFYKHILNGYNAQTLNADEVELVTYIQPVVAWYAAGEAAYSVSRKVSNKGIQLQNGDYSDSADFKELTFAIDHYKQKGHFYLNRLKKYLKDNKDLYPEFISQDNKDSDLYPGDCEEDQDSFNNSFQII